MTRRISRAAALALLAVGLMSLNARAPLVGLGPVLGGIQRDTGLNATVAGLLTAIPVLCFGLVTPAAAWFIGRIGINHANLYFFGGLAAGIVLRSFGGAAGAIAGTVVIGVAMTIVNVVTPLLVGRDFPHRAALMTGITTASVNVGTTLASALTAPFADAVGWQWSLVSWLGLTAIAAGTWLFLFPPSKDGPRWSDADFPSPLARAAARRRAELRAAQGQPGTQTGPLPKVPAPTLSPANRRMMRLFTAAFALHNLGYYAITLWLPTFLTQTRGMTPSEAGYAASLFQVFAILGPLLVPALARAFGWGAQPLFVLVAACWIALPLGLLAAPALWSLWALLGGIAQGGTFTVVFTVVIQRARSLDENRRMTAFIQSVGYGFAAAGPILMGFLRDAAGGWTAPFVFVLAAVVAMAVCGLAAVRTHDDGPRPGGTRGEGRAAASEAARPGKG
ncbi:MFS transporter [Sinomonas sp. ASV322]|uniref:MFS transporter n=1 Tax=Sinomonas sp. ASV322 TaxID=3041920 RepID=UPI0027DD7BDE|nr:MFS transporter [Sinomonas sp. ASV322]MDQ4503136.1 MFS transporter [Sinomonas sp. ASV322]